MFDAHGRNQAFDCHPIEHERRAFWHHVLLVLVMTSITVPCFLRSGNGGGELSAICNAGLHNTVAYCILKHLDLGPGDGDVVVI